MFVGDQLQGAGEHPRPADPRVIHQLGGRRWHKAVCYCNNRIGDWSQALTCLRMKLGRIWPNLKDTPTAIDISVTPVDRGPEEQGQAPLASAIGAHPINGSNVTASAIAGTSTSPTHCHTPTLVNPTESPGSCDDLPLPFDLPASVGTAEAKPIAINTTSADPSPPIGTAVEPAPADTPNDSIDIGRRFFE